MAGNFTVHREAKRWAREATLRNSEPNPARAVERSSLAAAASSSEDTTLIPPPSAPWGRFPPTSKAVGKSKGKEPVQAVPKPKRAREGGDVESSKKRPSQGSRQMETSEAMEVAAPTQVLELRISSGESSQGPSSFPWTREDFKMPEARRDLEKLSIKI